MEFSVRIVRRRGRILTDREIGDQTPMVGELRVADCLDERLKRFVKSASLSRTSQALHLTLLPDLHDVHLLGVTPIVFTLTGFEHVDGADYMQTWIVGEPSVALRRR